LDGDVAVLTQRYQHDPVRHESELQDDDTGNAEHHFWKVERADRTAHVARVVNSASPTIVFTRTRHGADRLAKQLAGAGVTAVALHGGRSQQQRNRALKDFASGRSQALVATDVAARGIHVEGVASVIHFDPPEDEKTYVHRSGRTARAGASGMVVSLVDGSQVKNAQRLQRALGLDSAMVTGHAPRLPKERVSSPSRPEHSRRSGDNESIYVGNLPFSVTGEDLERIFARHGRVHSATVVTHRDSRKSRGFGFVEMTPNASNAAIAALDGSSVAGRRLKVRTARPGVAHP
ncbi:MAG TPA: helicase-related protein, partial [Acidimicrobiia bacterium]|nr:helicase-related protein [Acidimicrobiia bacterium]